MLRTVVASAAVASAAAFAAPAALPTRTQVRVAMPCPSWFGFAAVITFLWTLPASAVFRSSSPEGLSAAGAAAVAERQIHAREPQLVASLNWWRHAAMLSCAGNSFSAALVLGTGHVNPSAWVRWASEIFRTDATYS